MQETNTVIMWPEKLKVGSKSKRGNSTHWVIVYYLLFLPKGSVQLLINLIG